MEPSLYAALAAFSERPPPFSRQTTRLLWTDPHIARQMLAFHCDETTDLASRSGTKIDALVGWLERRFGLRGRRVLDLGCGPGLYAIRMARRGAQVTGMDISTSSLTHARAMAAAEGLSIAYCEGDYVADPLPGAADLVLLIYGDYCALSPEQRAVLCRKVQASLAPGGVFVLDLFSPGQFDALTEGMVCGPRLMNGFWAEGDYFAIKSTLRYSCERVSLERYLVITPDRQFEVFNWMQYFTPDTISAELAAHGLLSDGPFDLVSGDRWRGDASAFLMVARR